MFTPIYLGKQSILTCAYFFKWVGETQPPDSGTIDSRYRRLLLIYTLGGLPPPRIPVGNEGLGWGSPILKMVHNPGGHCYCEGAISNIYLYSPPFETTR